MPRQPRYARTPADLDDVCTTCRERAGAHYSSIPLNAGVQRYTPECPYPNHERRPEGLRIYSTGFMSARLVGATAMCSGCDFAPDVHRSRDAACPARSRTGNLTGRYSRTRHYVPRSAATFEPSPHLAELYRQLMDESRLQPLPPVYTTTARTARLGRLAPRPRWPGEPGVYGYRHEGRTLCILCTREVLNVSAYSDARPADDVARDGFGIPVGTSTTTQLRHRIGRTPDWCEPNNADGCRLGCDRCYGELASHQPSYHGWCDCGDGCEVGDCDACNTPEVDEDERSEGCRCDHCTAPALPVMTAADITLRSAPDVSDADLAAMVAAFEDPQLAEA